MKQSNNPMHEEIINRTYQIIIKLLIILDEILIKKCWYQKHMAHHLIDLAKLNGLKM